MSEHTIVLNGKERSIAAGTTVAQLLDALSLNRDGVAVAVDKKVIPRSEHASWAIPAQARVEVIRAVGGG